eukprot:GFUD01093259.1.p2 GENE.GFUD01093259.1~~GFUD01093259.1.p2  ORF type:complete len:140 (+),score=72.13 GFUD01093259.1:133-552(+)
MDEWMVVLMEDLVDEVMVEEVMMVEEVVVEEVGEVFLVVENVEKEDQDHVHSLLEVDQAVPVVEGVEERVVEEEDLKTELQNKNLEEKQVTDVEVLVDVVEYLEEHLLLPEVHVILVEADPLVVEEEGALHVEEVGVVE